LELRTELKSIREEIMKLTIVSASANEIVALASRVQQLEAAVGINSKCPMCNKLSFARTESDRPSPGTHMCTCCGYTSNRAQGVLGTIP
jgi:predicted RNA-binding Zn-ribbon protein involved in translation (DUF1610 family)